LNHFRSQVSYWASFSVIIVAHATDTKIYTFICLDQEKEWQKKTSKSRRWRVLLICDDYVGRILEKKISRQFTVLYIYHNGSIAI
jgi:hypothetical protein